MKGGAALREAGRLAFASGARARRRLADSAARALLRTLAECWEVSYDVHCRPDEPEVGAAREAECRCQAARLRAAVRGRRVLELGCGDGVLLSLYAPAAREVHGADVSRRALAMARRRCRGSDNVRLRLLKSWSLPYPDGGFDVVLCRRTLSHLDMEAAVIVLREARRVLRDGGRLFFDLAHFHDEAYLEVLTVPGRSYWPSPNRQRFWTAGMVRALLPRLGLRLERLDVGRHLAVRAARVSRAGRRAGRRSPRRSA